MRLRFRLPPIWWLFPIPDRPVQFYPTPRDDTVLQQLEGVPFVVFAVAAGLPDRDVPPETTERLLRDVLERGYRPVFTGRSYERFGRREYQPAAPALNLIDELSVPGVARLLELSCGIVTCHSALSMLAWCVRKPQLLLYPPSVREGHIARRDQWAFGIDFPECRHCVFDDLRLQALTEEFLEIIAQSGVSG